MGAPFKIQKENSWLPIMWVTGIHWDHVWQDEPTGSPTLCDTHMQIKSLGQSQKVATKNRQYPSSARSLLRESPLGGVKGGEGQNEEFCRRNPQLNSNPDEPKKRPRSLREPTREGALAPRKRHLRQIHSALF